MKIEIIPDEKMVGEIDLNKFEEVMKCTPLDINKAVSESVSILKNDMGWSAGYITDVLVAEMDWGAIFLNFKHKMSDKMFFKMLPIKFEDKVEYERYAKSRDFKRIVLKENRKSGTKLILINSFNPNPEHNLDVWIAKSTFPYPESEWKKVIDVENG